MACPSGCSGHGQCADGACRCHVEWQGADCSEASVPFHAAFGTLFCMMACVAAFQLGVQIRQSGLHLTTQKLLLVFVVLASLVRGVYFAANQVLPDRVATELFGSFYPLVVSSLALLLCFWAEVYHLQSAKRGLFLDKSRWAFGLFLVVIYTVEIVKAVLGWFVDVNEAAYDGYLAGVNLFIGLMLFVYAARLFGPAFIAESTGDGGVRAPRAVWLSRLGVVTLAFFHLALIVVLVMNALNKAELVSFSATGWDTVLSNTLELALIVWWPCALWSPRGSAQLWVINPLNVAADESEALVVEAGTSAGTSAGSRAEAAQGECYICYDGSGAGLLITPCNCKGSVAHVHSACLARWLETHTESYGTFARSCKMCGAQFRLPTRAPTLVEIFRALGWRGWATLVAFCALSYFCFQMFILANEAAQGNLVLKGLIGFLLLASQVGIFIGFCRTATRMVRAVARLQHTPGASGAESINTAGSAR
eukprot:TRINITY_DN646_c0_g2_i1.p1 TRINITY_DN646_c0_g2~~TRINITY_DN646_c0_g2_i1.p1  ORF type:complete len:494 (-),score=115.29 TRINITY_DN646_c0_g2_i1:204-1640(-)